MFYFNKLWFGLHVFALHTFREFGFLVAEHFDLVQLIALAGRMLTGRFQQELFAAVDRQRFFGRQFKGAIDFFLYS